MEAREAIQVLTATVGRVQRGDLYNRALHCDQECEAVQVLSQHVSETLMIEIEVQELLNLTRKPGAKPQPGRTHAQLIADVIDAYGEVGMPSVDAAAVAMAKP